MAIRFEPVAAVAMLVPAMTAPTQAVAFNDYALVVRPTSPKPSPVVDRRLQELKFRQYELANIHRVVGASDGRLLPVTEVAVRHASRILAVAGEDGPVPTAVLPCGDGGVTLLFERGPLLAVVECFNDGDVVIAKSRGVNATQADEVAVDDTMARRVVDDVRRFIVVQAA